MNNQDYILEKVQELGATVTRCLICKIMKASITCDACNKPCCLSCIKSTTLIINNPNIYGSVHNAMILKRCPSCFKSRKICTDYQEIG